MQVNRGICRSCFVIVTLFYTELDQCLSALAQVLRLSKLSVSCLKHGLLSLVGLVTLACFGAGLTKGRQANCSHFLEIASDNPDVNGAYYNQQSNVTRALPKL